MKKFRILLITVLFLTGFTTILSCQTNTHEGETVKMNTKDFHQYWHGQNAVMFGDTLVLCDSGSSVIARNEVLNFSFSADILTLDGAEGFVEFPLNSENDSASREYAVVINNSVYRTGNPLKTGSLYHIRNNFVRMAEDGKWFNLNIIVQGSSIKVRVNDRIISEYTQPRNSMRKTESPGPFFTKGVIALQKSSSKGCLKALNVQYEIIEAGIELQGEPSSTNDSIDEMLTRLNKSGFPVIDFHSHMKGGLTVDQISMHGRLNGYNLGIAPNCGLNFPVTNDSSLHAFYDEYAGEPVFKAMQCEGREWITLFSPEVIARYDYIFTDAMTWTDYKGRRMRLWIPEETFVDDEQQFMDMLVNKIVAILSQEPVDIYVNPTYLPDAIAGHYNILWTQERMDRVIKALVENDVALEINSRFKIPSLEFVKRAKAAGVKFSLGTNNADNTDIGRLGYSLFIIREAGLSAEDMFIPRPEGQKKVLSKGLPVKITG